MKKIGLQKTFIFGITAVALVAIATGAIIRLQSISASTDTASVSCVAGSTAVQTDLSAEEASSFGASAKAYTVHTTQGWGRSNGGDFRLVVAAQEQSRLGSGGLVRFTVALGNLNNFVYAEKTGRIILKFSNSQQTIFEYGDPQLATGKYLIKQANWSVLDYSVSVNAEMRWGTGNYLQGCVSNAINLQEALGLVPTATSTATATATTSLTASATATTVSTQTTLDVLSGYNAVYLPDTQNALLTQQLKDVGMSVFEFNHKSLKSWDNDSNVFYHGIGYYVYNPGAETSVLVNSAPQTPETYYDRYIQNGWNLLSNGSTSDKKLSDLVYYVNNLCTIVSDKNGNPTSTAACDSLLSYKLSDLITSNAQTTRGYATLYIIKDPHGQTATDAFEQVDVTDQNKDSIVIPAGKLFWFYLFE
ncbi:MAG: hypothetical protein NTZ65_03860 [Candidatus Berkelbacteria bacterium]|nr:hypothetical protein [Candidatus Berkelbacteria bacterium]